jgi:hypothetical protein
MIRGDFTVYTHDRGTPMAQVATLVHDAASKAANRVHRVAVDKAKRVEAGSTDRARCDGQTMNGDP